MNSWIPILSNDLSFANIITSFDAYLVPDLTSGSLFWLLCISSMFTEDFLTFWHKKAHPVLSMLWPCNWLFLQTSLLLFIKDGI